MNRYTMLNQTNPHITICASVDPWDITDGFQICNTLHHNFIGNEQL